MENIAPAAPAADPKAIGTPAPGVATPEPTQDFTVNGKVVKLTAAQVKSAVQKGMFADQKLKSVDVLKQTTEKLLQDIKTPAGLLKLLKDPALGADPKAVFKAIMASDVIDDDLKEEMSQWVYKNVVEASKKTPEQVEQEKKLSEYEKMKAEKLEREQKDLTAKQQAQAQEIYQAVRSEVSKQITADKTFPQTEGSVRAVIEKLRVMNKKGVPINPDSVSKALAFVKKDHVLHQQAMFDALENPEDLIALVGEARALKISKALVARLQAKQKAGLEKKEAPTDSKETVQERIQRTTGRHRSGYLEMKL